MELPVLLGGLLDIAYIGSHFKCMIQKVKIVSVLPFTDCEHEVFCIIGCSLHLLSGCQSLPTIAQPH